MQQVSRVAILVRNDFYDKFGGDTFQVEQYIKYTEGCHFKVFLFSEIKNIVVADFDLFLLVNIDRGYEAYCFSRFIIQNGLLNKTFIVPIHHGYAAINAFNKRRMAERFSFGISFHPLLLEKVKSIFFSTRAGLPWNRILWHLLSARYFRLLRRLIIECRGAICIADGEYRSIRSDYKIIDDFQHYIIRNGVPEEIVSAAETDLSKMVRDIDVLVCGRIEERKNQVNIINALAGTGLNVTFLGTINQNNRRYANIFMALVEAYGNIDYISGCATEEVKNYYLRAKCHLSASWFEVSSLVDLESYFCGCSVVSSSTGYSQEILRKPGFRTVAPNSLENIRAAALLAVSEFEDAGPWQRCVGELSWRNAGNVLTGILVTNV